MGWSIGWDEHWQRDIGYGVPAYCDHPKCNSVIDRGLAHVCCGQEPYGGEGCGLFFCPEHQDYKGRCPKCSRYDHRPYKAKPDHPDWVKFKLTDESWQQWRTENPDIVTEMLSDQEGGL